MASTAPRAPGPFRRAVSKAVASALQDGWRWASFAGAVTAGGRAASRFGRFGAGSMIRFPVTELFNERYIHVGDNTIIGAYVTLTAGMVPGQRMLTDPVISIGDNCRIGRNSEIVGHLGIVIEDDVYTGPYVYITDQNHAYGDRDLPVGAQSMPERPVRIGAGSWIGQGATILPGVTVGRHAVVAAGAVVTRDVPDYSVVAGVPARVVSRPDIG